MPFTSLIKEPKIFNQFMNLSEECLGKDPEMLKILNEKKANISINNDEQNNLQGFLAFFTANSEEEIKQTIGNKKIKNSLTYPCGVLHAIGIIKEKRKNGIANDLIVAAEEDLIKKNINTIIGAAWEYNGIIPADHNLRKLGYKELERISTPWQEECDSGEFCCPHRDKENHRCICNAVIYYKTGLTR